MDLGEQRALQDWYVKFALQNVPGVSEIASFGGFQKQYQVTLDPNKLNYYGLSVPQVIQTIRSNNNEAGGRKFGMRSDEQKSELQSLMRFSYAVFCFTQTFILYYKYEQHI